MMVVLFLLIFHVFFLLVSTSYSITFIVLLNMFSPDLMFMFCFFKTCEIISLKSEHVHPAQVAMCTSAKHGYRKEIVLTCSKPSQTHQNNLLGPIGKQIKSMQR